MQIDEKRCAAEISITQFLKNYKQVKNLLPEGCRLMAVLKGNAYGHGAAVLAKEIENYSEDWIAVASLGEALELREAGVKKEILILGYTPPEYAALLGENKITQAIISYGYGEQLALAAKKVSTRVACHLAVDTGMSRIGLLAYGKDREKSIEEAISLYNNPSLCIGGIFTHFSSAYGIKPEDQEYTRLQYERFCSFFREIESKGITVGLRHCNNSPSIVNYPEYALDMCRGGTLLFGALDQSEMLRPIDLPIVMRFRTIVTMIKEIQKGTPISYARTAVAQRDMRLAVLGVGWYDGYPRQLGNKGKVLIRGEEHPIVGRICMDLCMADITDSPDVSVGDEVILLGKQMEKEIHFSDLYKPLGIGAGSISGGISTRVPRIYRKD